MWGGIKRMSGKIAHCRNPSVSVVSLSILVTAQKQISSGAIAQLFTLLFERKPRGRLFTGATREQQ